MSVAKYEINKKLITNFSIFNDNRKKVGIILAEFYAIFVSWRANKVEVFTCSSNFFSNIGVTLLKKKESIAILFYGI